MWCRCVEEMCEVGRESFACKSFIYAQKDYTFLLDHLQKTLGPTTGHIAGILLSQLHSMDARRRPVGPHNA